MRSDRQDKKVVIEFRENGPIIVKGLENCRNSRGEQVPTKESMALCRCGASSNKPFCDGTHRTIAFSDRRLIDKPLNKEKAYQGKNITVYDNRRICSHAAECVGNLSSVFDSKARPWINPDGADVKVIIAAIKKCPSGALSYSVDGVHHRDEEREPAIDIVRNGPYNVVGRIKLQVSDALQPPSKEHYALCRCGASRNKPYCDGRHAEINFKDEKN